MERGVDVTLAVNIIPRSTDKPDLRTIVLIANDGDYMDCIAEVVSQGRAFFLCTNKHACPSHMFEYVMQKDGKGVWLDELLDMAWERVLSITTTGHKKSISSVSSAGYDKEDTGSGLGALLMKKRTHRCPAGRTCQVGKVPLYLYF